MTTSSPLMAKAAGWIDGIAASVKAIRPMATVASSRRHSAKSSTWSRRSRSAVATRRPRGRSLQGQRDGDLLRPRRHRSPVTRITHRSPHGGHHGTFAERQQLLVQPAGKDPMPAGCDELAQRFGVVRLVRRERRFADGPAGEQPHRPAAQRSGVLGRIVAGLFAPSTNVDGMPSTTASNPVGSGCCSTGTALATRPPARPASQSWRPSATAAAISLVDPCLLAQVTSTLSRSTLTGAPGSSRAAPRRTRSWDRQCPTGPRLTTDRGPRRGGYWGPRRRDLHPRGPGPSRSAGTHRCAGLTRVPNRGATSTTLRSGRRSIGASDQGPCPYDGDVPRGGVARRVLLCGGADYAVCRAGWSITALASLRRVSMAVGSGGVSRAIEPSER